MKKNDPLFPKAPVLSIRLFWPSKKLKRLNWSIYLFTYVRMANASSILLPFMDITWRRPWLPGAAYASGWDACFRQMCLKGDVS